MRAAVVVLALAGAGCFSKPEFTGGSGDAGSDGGPHSGAPTVTLLSTAYANSYSAQPRFRSQGMDRTTWEIRAGDVHKDDLLLFIANVDNGSDTVWVGLEALGFATLFQTYYNAGDGQTFTVYWKIAGDSEPVKYNGTFGTGIDSAAATLTLLAVTGYDPDMPIGDSIAAVEPGTTGTMPSTATSPGVRTFLPDSLLIWATGSDWLSTSSGNNTFVEPDGFTPVVTLADHGDTATFDWTSQQVASHVQTQVGSTGPIHGTLAGSCKGTPWDVLFVIPPAPI